MPSEELGTKTHHSYTLKLLESVPEESDRRDRESMNALASLEAQNASLRSRVTALEDTLTDLEDTLTDLEDKFAAVVTSGTH